MDFYDWSFKKTLRVSKQGIPEPFTLKNVFNPIIEKLISNFIPIKRYKDENFFKKLLCASIINFLYKNSNILTFGSYATEVLFKISPTIEIDEKNLKELEIKLDECLSTGINSLIADFIKYKFSKKI